MKNLLTFLLLLSFLTGSTQDGSSDESKFKFGLNVGAYFANKNTANFYNGVFPNSISNVINLPNNYNRIKETLIFDFSLTNESFPTDMRYSPSILFGVNTEYRFAKDASIFADINFVNVSTSDKFTLELADGSSGVGNRIETYDINGKENRFNVSLMLRNYSGDDDQLKFYFDLGASVTGSRVSENQIQIEDLTFNIISPDLPQFSYFPNQSNLSLGFVGGLGVAYKMSDDLAINFGLNLNYERIELLDAEVYKKYYLNKALILRLVKM